MVVLSCIHISSLFDGRDGPLAWGLGVMLGTPHRKKRSQYLELHMKLTIQATENFVYFTNKNIRF